MTEIEIISYIQTPVLFFVFGKIIYEILQAIKNRNTKCY